MTWEEVLRKLIGIEIKGIEFYKNLQSQIEDQQVLSILKVCQKGEENHRDYLQGVYQDLSEQDQLKELDLNELPIDEFQFPDWSKLSQSETVKEAIILALNLENSTIDYLNSIKPEYSDQEKRNLINFLIEEEKEHIKSLVKLSHNLENIEDLEGIII